MSTLNRPGDLSPHRTVNKLVMALVLALWIAGCQPAPNPTQRSGINTPAQDETTEPGPVRKTPTAKGVQNPTPTPAPEDVFGVEPNDLQGTTVQFWNAWSGKAGEMIGELAAQFNAENEWGIIVEASQYGSYDELFAVVEGALDDSTPPDLVAAYIYQAQNWNAGKAPLVDLADYVNHAIYGLDAEEQADFYPGFWEHDLISGKRLGIPAQRSVQVLYYNLSWAQELGYTTPPETTEEFREQACAAAQDGRAGDGPANEQVSGWIVSTDYPTVLGWLSAFGSQIVLPGDKGYRFNSAAVNDALTFMRQVYNQGCAWFAEDQPIQDDFAQRLGLFASGSVAEIPYQQAAFRRAGSRDRWTVIPFPSPNGEPAVSAYGPSFMLLKSSPEEQLAAWLFIRWLVSPTNQAKLAEASSTLPLRASTLDYLLEFRPGLSSQWESAAELLSVMQDEPNYRSWNEVRWAVSDAATQLFRWYFTLDQLPTTIQLLDRTAAELHKRSP